MIHARQPFELPFRDPDTELTDEQRFLRRETLAEIETEPGSFDMGDWEHAWNDKPDDQCKTTRCIAGTVQWIRRGRVYADGDPALAIPDAASDGVALLGLSEQEFYARGNRDGLWYTDNEAAIQRLRELAAA
jgi:hypothetical protein